MEEDMNSKYKSYRRHQFETAWIHEYDEVVTHANFTTVDGERTLRSPRYKRIEIGRLPSYRKSIRRDELIDRVSHLSTPH
jgi:hypothetical protein